MMKKTGIISVVILLLTLGCQEVYYPEDLVEDTDIVVVEGYVSNGAGPHTVKLSYAASFTSDNSSIPINNAKITLSDDQGNSAIMTNNQYGTYKTETGQLEGVPGRKYKINIRLANGAVYESKEEIMPEPITNYEVYTSAGETSVIDKNTYGDIIVKNFEGLDLLINQSDSIKKFARIDVTVIFQYLHYVLYGPEVISPPSPYYLVYCWEKTRFVDYPIIFYSRFNGEEFEVKDFNMGFLTYIYDPSEATDTSSAPSPKGWILEITINSINENAYIFNNEIKSQLMASEHIFDPIPSTIKGNIKCITDSTAQVTGCLEVSAKTIVKKGYYWYPGKRKITEQTLEDYIMPTGPGCTDTIPPDTWVDLD